MGVELLRVLLQSARPILMIAFTNHALDHMLCGVLDANITKKIVRLGGRSADERISGYSMENLEKVAGKSILDKGFGRHYRELKEAEKEIENFMREYMRKDASAADITRYLQIQYPEHFEYLHSSPDWVSLLHQSVVDDKEGWEQAGPRGQRQEVDHSIYSFWSQGSDIAFLSHPFFPAQAPSPDPPVRTESGPMSQANRFGRLVVETKPVDDEEPVDDEPVTFTEFWESPDVWVAPMGSESRLTATEPVGEPEEAEEEGSVGSDDRATLIQKDLATAVLSNVEQFFAEAEVAPVPGIPTSDRNLGVLLADGNVWDMSLAERKKLHEYWKNDVVTRRSATYEQDFEALRRRHEEAQRTFNEGRDEVSCSWCWPLRATDSTTTLPTDQEAVAEGYRYRGVYHHGRCETHFAAEGM